MASSFAAQLRNIAQNSTHELDLRARRTAHAESLLFPKEIAAKQDFDTIYAICLQGFHELCALDATFVEFERNLFSAQSVKTEREQMTKSENEALDKVLERALGALGSKLLLKPGVRCLEWLVRRFKVHLYNTSALLLSVLPWHEMGIWRNVLSLVPKDKCVAEWKFLGMYKQEALNVPRAAIVHAMTTNNGFFDLMNRYVVELANEEMAYTGLLKFWTSVMAEAVVGRLNAARSGRKEIQRQRTEDVLLKVLPLLSVGFEMRDCPDLVMACFTLSMLLAGSADLDDRVLDSLLQAIATAALYPETDKRAALITMIVVVCQKQTRAMPKAGFEVIANIPNLENLLLELRKTYPVDVLIESLVTGALSGMKRKYITDRMTFTERMIRISTKLNLQAASNAIRVVLSHLEKNQNDNEVESAIRTELIEMLQRLNEEHSVSLAIFEASQSLDLNPLELETLLGSTLLAIEPNSIEDVDTMDLDQPESVNASVDQLIEQLPSRTLETVSFLGKHDENLYDQLVECFLACCKSQTALKRFVSLPIWQSSQTSNLLFDSLLLRIAVGPFGGSQKSIALRLLAQNLELLESADTQAFLPYVLAALATPVQSVRRSAADVLITMDKVAPSEADLSQEYDSDFYGGSSVTDLKSIATSKFKKIIDQAFLPALEECVLDASHIIHVVGNTLNGNERPPQTPSKSNKMELKKSLRHDLFELLASHAIQTPLIKVQITTIRLLEHVNKVGSSTKSKALEPLLKMWSSYDEVQAARIANAARLTLSEIDIAMLKIVSPHDKEAIIRALSIFEENGNASRVELVAAFFDRVQLVWKNLKHETQVSMAQRIFELAFQNKSSLANGAQGVLRLIDLSTDILGSMLELSISGITKMQNEEEQPKKKRRTSHGRESLPPDLALILTTAASKLTFALELVDGAKPETKPELSPVLFDILSTIKRLKQQQRINLPYLQNLCLSNILAMVDAQRHLPKPTIDVSSIRADLVTECIRTSDNPQVQTTALLLSSSLASIAPDRMLHNVMPIFTFMGQSMFSKDDDHSVHVINQAIDKIIPALVDSLRNQNMDLIKSTSSLLASFTAAFDHIPQHRRVAMYARLLGRMGAQDFTFIVLCLLAQRKAHHPTFDAFLVDLLAELDPETQLLTVQKTVHLANDVLSDRSQLAEDIFGIQQPITIHERNRLSKIVYGVALTVLRSKSLKAQANRLHKLNTEVADKLRSEIYACFRLILSSVRKHRLDGSDVVEEVKQCLDALLKLPSLIELFAILPQALVNEEVDADLKPQALRVLATQLQSNPSRDTKTRVAAIQLLSNLTEMLQTDLNVPMKQAIVVCVDRLSEVYGRKDVETVISAANAVASDQCLGFGDRRLEVMSMLSLASMLEVLQEACIPIVPEMMPKVISILGNITHNDLHDEELHNSAFALIAAIVSHVPFLISDENLQATMLLSSLSAPNYSSTAATESRTEALSIIAHKTDLRSLLKTSLGETLDAVRENPENAELEHLDMLSSAIETAGKSTVGKNAELVSQVLLSHLDQRSRIYSAETEVDDDLSQAVSDVESKIKSMSIQFIYKLNDTAFRPIFETWIDWAINAYDVEDSGLREKMLPIRRTSMFILLTNFFQTLKSIVTSYASYIVPISHAILAETASSVDTKKSSQLSINLDSYTALLNMLRSTFDHDADAFYSTPSHFEPLASPLVSQLKLAISKSLRNAIYALVVPSIVSLATATLDTPAHHQTISHELVQLRHSSSAAVRLASIKTFATITADEAVGDDFIANVIGIGSGEGEGARGIGGGGSVGEIMIYVNEMLEDDDEDVEREVRKWVQAVREKTGEDVFEV